MRAVIAFGTLVVCLALVLTPKVAVAGFEGTSLYLPSVGRGPGSNDSYWYTSVWLFNPGSSDQQVQVSWLKRGQANFVPDQQTLVLHGGETLSIPDVLLDLFGLNEGSGALRFSSAAPLIVSSRIFNQTGSDPAESQGQFFAGTPTELAIGLGESTDIVGVSNPQGDTFRCNFGMVETFGADAEVAATVFDGDGTALGSRSYALRAFEPIQKNLTDLAGGHRFDGGRLHLEVISGDGRIIAFASLVGNGAVVQDPSSLEMKYDFPQGGAGGDIEGVTAGNGLTGGGQQGTVSLDVGAGPGIEVSADAVGVADDGVTSSMIQDNTVVRGLTVEGKVLRDDIELKAGVNVSITHSGNEIEVAAVGTLPVLLELPVTTLDGAWTTRRATGIPFLTHDGSWHLQLNISGTTWSSQTDIVLVVAGVEFKNITGFAQPLAVYLGSSMTTGVARTVPGTNQIAVSVVSGSARSQFSVSGMVELETAPVFPF